MKSKGFESTERWDNTPQRTGRGEEEGAGDIIVGDGRRFSAYLDALHFNQHYDSELIWRVDILCFIYLWVLAQ